jgi:hypothetical protein
VSGAGRNGGTAQQQRLRDLGLPPGPNPGRELLRKVEAALALGDTDSFAILRDQVVQAQHEACAAGGETVHSMIAG